MKVLIVNTAIDEAKSSRTLGRIDRALQMELYCKYQPFGITANTIFDKYTYIDEKQAYIGTFRTMEKLLLRHLFLGNVFIITVEQWLDKVSNDWKTNPHYDHY